MNDKRVRGGRGSSGFTLVELLVVITIVMLVAAVALPAVLSGLSERQVTEAARILQAAVAGARDNAIRANEPRGIRFLPDPTLISAPIFNTDGSLKTRRGALLLAYNRMVQIEPAPDYQEGLVSIGPYLPPGLTLTGFPPTDPHGSGNYPFYDSTPLALGGRTTQVLMVEESIYQGGFIPPAGPSGDPLPNPPVSWFWNIRVGDKIRFGSSGRYYTIVGPCTINPYTASGKNPELFVNTGDPGTASTLRRNYYSAGTPPVELSTDFSPRHPEFLLLVNGQDDDGNGYIDEGFDGFDNDYQNGIDDVVFNTTTGRTGEWETESWLGSLGHQSLFDQPSTMPPYTQSPSPDWVSASFTSSSTDLSYTIKRRPVPTQGTRETLLPGGVVIDATSADPIAVNPTNERSRLPIDPNSLYVDFMVNSDGQVIPQTIYSTPVSFNEPFFHFWLTDRKDVVEPIVNNDIPYTLPMPAGTNLYPNTHDTSGRKLTGERRLVSVFTNCLFHNADSYVERG